MISTGPILVLSGILFAVGAVGVVIRRNILVVLMCIELMLNAVNLTFVAFSQSTGGVQGQVAALFVMLVAAAEAAVGFAIVIAVYRCVKSSETTDSGELQG